jgi:diguanylate cyclase (GGDEF)-like protein
MEPGGCGGQVSSIHDAPRDASRGPTSRRVPPWALYLVLGVIGGSAFATTHDSWGTWGASVVQASAALAVVYGTVRFKPERPLFWWLLAGGQLMYAAAQGYWRIRFDAWRGQIPFGDLNDALYIGALLLFIAALAVGPRPRSAGGSWAGTIDGAAVVLGLAFGTWNLIAEPYVAAGHLGPWDITVFLTYEGLEVLRMALLARIVLAGGLPRSTLLMTAGMLIQLTADLVYGITLTMPSGPLDAWQNAGWIVGSVFIGAAGLHPAMSGRHGRVAPDEAVSRLRLVTFLLLIMIYPVTVVLDAVLNHQQAPDARFLTGTLMPVMLVVAVATLLIVRLGLLTGLAQRRAAELQRALRTENALRDRLSHQANHDPLTGLVNRTVLTDALGAAVTGDATWTLLLIDLDGFKEINDLHGHPAGDAVLTEAARRLGEAAPGAVVARLGGDEFAVLTPHGTPADADALAQRIVGALAAPYRANGLELVITCSTGVLMVPPGATVSEAMRDVDLALYAAKADGRARVMRFHDGLHTAWNRHQTISQGLRRALRDGGLVLHYQPIVDMGSGRITGLEALTRWTPPGQPAVAPAEFIPVAEQTGLIAELGLWALRTACTEVLPWYRRHGISVAVNVSARQLQDPGFCDEVLMVLAEVGFPGRALTLEITESMLIGAAGAISDAVIDALQQLRAHGIRIAIDDFGTGYSSLAYLHQLPVDVLKLDRSLTLSGGPTTQKIAITRAVIDLGVGLDLQTVAEGVETADQADLLRRMGSPSAQGFYFARPMPAAAVPAALDLANALAHDGA